MTTADSTEASSLLSPDGGFQFEELLRGLDDPDVVAGQDAGAQEEAHVPVALQLVQAAFLAYQAAQLHPWKYTNHCSDQAQILRLQRGRGNIIWKKYW